MTYPRSSPSDSDGNMEILIGQVARLTEAVTLGFQDFRAEFQDFRAELVELKEVSKQQAETAKQQAESVARLSAIVEALIQRDR